MPKTRPCQGASKTTFAVGRRRRYVAVEQELVQRSLFDDLIVCHQSTATPIMASRGTIAASDSSSRSSVPAGRSGSTR